MRKEAVLHIPLSQYAYATDERTITVRIRTARNDMDSCTLCYGNRVAEVEPIPVTALVMDRCARDDLFDYYEARISSDYNRVCYYFRLESGSEVQYYYSRGFCDRMEANRTEYFQFPYIRREEILHKPEWTKDAVMYHIFPDSFANAVKSISPEGKLNDDTGLSKNLHGGTLRGIIENIGYLKDLGVNIVYLNPIFRANSYHKYDTVDYFDIDPCFGTKEDFKELVDTLHANGMRIVLDGVFNHSGPDFFAFKDVLENDEKSEYRDWFYKLNFPIQYKYPPNYECFAYVKQMPKLNTGNPVVRDYICSVGRYWITEFGIDGWRLDVANEVDHDTWRAFRRAVLGEKPDALLIAEIWEDADVWLKGDQFDSAMNYMFTYLCRDFFASGTIGANEFDEQMQKALMRYPWPVAKVQMNFLDSHDVPRFLHYCNGNTERLRLAFFYLMMSPGIPSVFYGDEVYMTGSTEAEYRAPYPWNETGKGFIKELSEWIYVRKKHPALTEGKYAKVYADEKSLYVFERSCDDEALIIVVNNSEDGSSILCDDISADAADAVYLGEGARIEDGKLCIGAFGGAVLKKK